MRYLLYTLDYVCPLYFAYSPKDSFKMSTVQEEALQIEGQERALNEARRLSKESGITIQIKEA
jgi:hypothetical protein